MNKHTSSYEIKQEVCYGVKIKYCTESMPDAEIKQATTHPLPQKELFNDCSSQR